MKFQSFILYFWSSLATKVWLFEISSSIPCELNSIQSSYYLEADTNSRHIEPTEELKRTQRSFLKKFWKDTGLQDLFSDNGCVNCCNNDNYNAGEGDTYETPPTSSYMPYFQQIPALTAVQPFDPLRIFQPFLRPVDFNTNGVNGAGHINIYDKDNIPKRYGENSNVINDDYKEGYSNKNSEANEDTECKNIKEKKMKENNNYSRDKSYNIGPILTEEDGTIYDKISKDSYQNTQPVEDVYVYPDAKSKATQTKQAYPSLNDDSGSIVYQPIIYVSPQYHVVPPMYNSAHNWNQKSEESNPHYPNFETQHHVYTKEKEDQKLSQPLHDKFKWRPNTKDTYSDPNLPCGVSPYSKVLSNKEYTPLLPSTYGVVSQCNDIKVKPSDIAIYTILTKIPSTSHAQAFNANPYIYLNTINGNYKEPTSPIILTQADQPYRNCPELFTDFLNQENYNQNHVKGNTFVNAQYISC